MWFVLLAFALLFLTVAALYTWRRLARSLEVLRVRSTRVRLARWLTVWLLLAYPAYNIIGVVLILSLGVPWPRLDGTLAAMLFVVPFAWAALVVVQTFLWLLILDLVWFVHRRLSGTAASPRRRALATLLLLAGFAVYTPTRVLIERGNLQVRHHEVRAPQPTGAPPFRVVFLADVQQNSHIDSAHAQRIYRRVNDETPELILYGGDWIDFGPQHISEAAATSEMLRSRLGTWSVVGDHEHFVYPRDPVRSVEAVRAALERHGVHMLADQTRWFEHRGRSIAVAFLNNNYVHRASEATIESLVTSLDRADFKIVVTHQLDSMVAALLKAW